ncbi:MAG: response regulator [Rhodocyclaceae bacterium]|nr:response regulator [Rhodocyclaceae bacterium]
MRRKADDPPATRPTDRADPARLARRIGFATAAAVLLLGGLSLWRDDRQARALARANAELAAHLLADRVADALMRAENLAQALTHLPLARVATQAEFERLTEHLVLLAGPGVSLQWAPGAVVRFSAPLAGNTPAIGHDLRTDPQRDAGVAQGIDGGLARWSGPFQRQQGGTGLVFSAPVFSEPSPPSPAGFQGLTISLLGFPDALAGAVGQAGPDHDFRIWIGAPEQTPLPVWGQAWPEGEVSFRIQQTWTGSPADADGSGEPGLDIVVAARPRAEVDTGLAARMPLLATLATGLGWLAWALARQQLSHRSLLRQAQELHQAQGVLAHSLCGMVLFDHGGQVSWCNPRASEVLGVPLEQLLTLNGLSNPLFRRKGWDAALRDTRADGRQRRFDYAGPGAFGQPVDIAFSFTRVDLGGRPLVMSQILDMSTIHAAEAELASRAQRLALATEAARIGIWELDLTSGLATWDARLDDIYARPAEDRGQPVTHGAWRQRVHPGDIAATEAARRTMVEQCAPGIHSEQFRIVRPDGEIRHVEDAMILALDDGGRPLRVIGVARDVTERVLLTSRLRGQAAELSTILDNSTVGIAMLRDRRIVWANQALADLLRLPLAALSGRPLSQNYVTQEDYERIGKACYPVLAKGENYKTEVRQRAADGSIFWARISGKAIDCAAPLGGSIWVVEDISRQRQALESLEVARKAAEAASLAKTQLLANVSHELRTPLNVSQGLLQLLEQGSLPPTEHDYAQRALAATHSLGRLIDDMIDFARIDAGALAIVPSPFAPRTVLAELLTNLEPAAQSKGLALEMHLEETLPDRLLGDARRLGQILTNLLGNAIKFTREGRVALVADWSASRDTADSDGSRAGELRLAVTDSGPGMTAQQRERIFERFYQIDGAGAEGVGIGLTISRGLAERMGGHIEVASMPEHGSTFTLCLPLAAVADASDSPEDANASDESSVSSGDRRSGDDRRVGGDRRFKSDSSIDRDTRPLAGLRILVAEDNPDNQFVIRALLKQLGADVHLASDGRKALQYAREAKPPYDAVLMDMRMPKMDGLAATRAIRAIDGLAGMPIIALTANASAEDRRACTEAGMSSFIAKPIDGRKLERVLCQACGLTGPSAAPPAAESPQAFAADPDGFELATALERIGGDRDIFAAMVRRFLLTQDETLRKLEQALASARFDEAGGLLHTLRGSALSLGAMELAAVAQHSEHQLSQVPPPDVDALLSAVRAAMNRTRDALSAILPPQPIHP